LKLLGYFGEVLAEHLPFLLSGYRLTAMLVLVAFVGSLALGLLVAGIRLAPIPIAPGIARAEVELFRNTPLLIQMSLFWLGTASIGIRLSPFQAGAIALTLYTGAYVTEVVRAGVSTVSSGQFEAARSLGLTFSQVLGLVVMPQAVRTVIPPLGNLLIAMIKNSAIASAIAVPELLYQSQVLDGRTFRTFEIFTGVLIGYLSLTIPAGFGLRRLETAVAIKR
jgi:glutamate transport system permease protein